MKVFLLLLVNDCLILLSYNGISEIWFDRCGIIHDTDLPSQVCREWEASALKVHKDVRLALIRFGVVLGRDGGALGMLARRQFKF